MSVGRDRIMSVLCACDIFEVEKACMLGHGKKVLCVQPASRKGELFGAMTVT